MMSEFHYKKVCFIKILVFVVMFCNDNVIGKSVQWPPIAIEFLDPDNDGIRGIGGKDYPIYETIPKTSFSCNGQIPGYYADQETDCQVFHLCFNNHITSFLCGNGTIFNQQLFTCDWWYDTSCKNAHKFYSINLELYKSKEKPNDSLKSKQIREIESKNMNNEDEDQFQKFSRLPIMTRPKTPINPVEINRKKYQIINQKHNTKPIRHMIVDTELEESESDPEDDKQHSH